MTDVTSHVDVTHVGFVKKIICPHQPHQYVESYVQVKHFVLWLKPVVGLSDAPM